MEGAFPRGPLARLRVSVPLLLSDCEHLSSIQPSPACLRGSYIEPQLLGKVGLSAEGQGESAGSYMSLLRNRARPLQTLFSCTCIATRLTVSHTDGETEALCKLGHSLGYK